MQISIRYLQVWTSEGTGKYMQLDGSSSSFHLIWFFPWKNMDLEDNFNTDQKIPGDYNPISFPASISVNIYYESMIPF